MESAHLFESANFEQVSQAGGLENCRFPVAGSSISSASMRSALPQAASPFLIGTHKGQPPRSSFGRQDVSLLQRFELFSGVSLTRGGTTSSLNTFGLVCLYLACSVGFTSYNKYLMDYSRFPHPTHLVWIQSLFISCFTGLLLVMRPNLFPALRSGRLAKDMNLKMFVGVVLPLALLLSISRVMNNAAYLHSSLAFLQMMRGSGVVFSYLLALYLMIERLSWTKVQMLTVVLGATALTIYGERSLSTSGFVLQGMALLLESLRGGLQIFLLKGAACKVDALTYMLLVMPASMALLSVACGAKDAFGLSTDVSGPSHIDILAWSGHLVANSCLGFLVSVLNTTLCEHASTAGFSILGLARDTIVVGVGVGLIQETVSPTQGLGFCIQVAAAGCYAVAQISPSKSSDKLQDESDSRKETLR